MVLSAALDKGFIFLSIIAILTSVISAAYYLNIIKETFFYSSKYYVNPLLENMVTYGNIYDRYNNFIKSVNFNHNNISISSPIAYYNICNNISNLVIYIYE